MLNLMREVYRDETTMRNYQLLLLLLQNVM